MGATSGIGMEIAKLCIAAGWRVGIAGRRAEPLEKLRMSAPSQVVAGCIDITRESSATELIRLVEKLGGMDIYCHVSGIGAQNPTLDPAVELRTMETNVMGFTRMITAAYNYFARQGSGHIAVITSIAGTKGLGTATAYSASKRMQNTYLDALSQLSHMRKLSFSGYRAPSPPGNYRLEILCFGILLASHSCGIVGANAGQCNKKRMIISFMKEKSRVICLPGIFSKYTVTFCC